MSKQLIGISIGTQGSVIGTLKGKIVDVIYARKKITGWYDVRLNEPDKLPENYSAVAKGFSIAGIMCLTSAIAIFCICLKLTLL